MKYFKKHLDIWFDNEDMDAVFEVIGKEDLSERDLNAIRGILENNINNDLRPNLIWATEFYLKKRED